MVTESVDKQDAQHLQAPSALAVAILVSHGEKLEKCNGLNFKWWQQRMLFYLTMMNLA